MPFLRGNVPKTVLFTHLYLSVGPTGPTQKVSCVKFSLPFNFFVPLESLTDPDPRHPRERIRIRITGTLKTALLVLWRTYVTFVFMDSACGVEATFLQNPRNPPGFASESGLES